MATLKDHQQAMVDLLASGSGIPASASRLAHAMHDVLCHLTEAKPVTLDMKSVIRAVEANSPGLNDKALAADVEACRIKLTGAGGGPKAAPAERRVKELENTVNQLRARNAELRGVRYHMATKIAELQSFVDRVKEADAVALRQSDCQHNFTYRSGEAAGHCLKCGLKALPEQAGCRKDDTQVCEHVWKDDGRLFVCRKCGVHPSDVPDKELRGTK